MLNTKSNKNYASENYLGKPENNRILHEELFPSIKKMAICFHIESL